MKTRLRKGKDFLKRISAGAAAALMAVVTVISNMEPLVAKAEGYTLVGYDNSVSYSDAFSGIDGEMGNWKSWEFSVETPDGDVVQAMCAEPHKMQPGIGSTFTDGGTYVNDTIARIFYFSVGSGVSQGPLDGYDYDLRWIIAHHTVAYALDDDMWNEPAIGGTFLGGPGKAGYDLCMELYSYAYNLDSGDYDCYAKFLSNDDGVNQSLCIFWDEYHPAPVYYDGSIQFKKASANEDISNDNSCYSLEGAEISVYNDADCTDLVTRLYTDENGDTDTYTVYDILEGETRTFYYKETAAPKGFLINDEVKSVTIDGEGTFGGGIYDTPETDPVTILLRKVNKETGSVSNGAGTLQGAKYVIKYYDTDMTTDPAASGKTPKYTYYAQTGADGRINLRNSESYIGGDTLLKNGNGDVVFPLGTLTVQEYEAPEGYLLDETVFVTNLFTQNYYVNGVKQNIATSYQEADSTVIHLEQEVKGKVSLTKKMTAIKDGGSYVKTAQKSSLTENVPEEGAEFQIYYKGAGSYEEATEAQKVNKETGSVSNGAGTLQGAKYVIKYYDTDMTTDPAASGKTPKYTYYAQTGADGRIRLRDSQCYIGGDTLFKDDRDNVVFPLGTLTIQEYDAPEGYLLDETVFVNNIFKNKIYVNGVEQNIATSYQEADSTVIHLEQEVKGKVLLSKKMTVIKDGGSYVKTAQKSSLTENVPEEGAEFQIYYKGAGSYEEATEAQRDILRTGADGIATSKDLPYGNYVIHQISGASNCTFMDDMEVSISENAVTYEVSATDIQKLNKLRLYKKGEVVTGYNKDTGFVYEERYIGGCSYQVYADEDCSDAGFIEQITSKDGGYAESAYEYKAGTY